MSTRNTKKSMKKITCVTTKENLIIITSALYDINLVKIISLSKNKESTIKIQYATSSTLH